MLTKNMIISVMLARKMAGNSVRRMYEPETTRCAHIGEVDTTTESLR